MIHTLHPAAVIPDEPDSLADMQAARRHCQAMADDWKADGNAILSEMWQIDADQIATRIEDHYRATALHAADRIAHDRDDVPLYGDGDLGFGDRASGPGRFVLVVLAALVAALALLGLAFWRVLSGGIVT